MSDLFATEHDSPEGSGSFNTELLVEAIAAIRRRWIWVAAVALIGMGFGVVHYLITPRLFQASTKIHIQRKTLASLANPQMAFYEGLFNFEYYPTQYKLIASNGVAERVVRSLRLWENPKFGGKNSERSPDSSVAPTSAQDEAAIARMARRLRISVAPEKGTELVNLRFVHADPEFSAMIANEWAQQYIQLGIDQRRTRAGAATDFFTNQIRDVRAEISGRRQDLNSLTREAENLSLDADADLANERLKALESARTEAQQDRVRLEAAYQQLQGQSQAAIARNRGASEAGALERDLRAKEQEVSSLRERYRPGHPTLSDAEAALEEAENAYRRGITRIASATREQARSDYRAAVSREDQLAEEIAQTRSQATEDSTQSSEADSLRREILGLETRLTQLQQQQSGSSATSDLSETNDTNVHVIERAVPPGGPFQPNLKNDVMSGLLFGGMLGLLLVLGVHYMDNTIKTPEQAERTFGLPTLGIIPDASAKSRRYGYRYGRYGYRYNYRYSYSSYGGEAKSSANQQSSEDESTDPNIELIPLRKPHSVLAEAYRSLRAALLMSSADTLGAVAVTSADVGEGKSSTAVNLGIVMAQLDKRVLIIDADLRRPRQHKIFEVSNRTGNVTVLTGGSDLSEAVQLTQVANLSVLTSGPIPPNPSELLSSNKMGQMVDEARKYYDFVIIDAPPVLAVSDPMLVALHVDGLVLTVSAGILRRDHARAARARLQVAGTKVLGLVLNRFNPEGTGSKYRRYRYNYKSSYRSSDSSIRDTAA